VPKVKLTKGELKRQRDALRQYERFLPTLQLKKQQLQLEILNVTRAADKKKAARETHLSEAAEWGGLLTDKEVDLRAWISPHEIKRSFRNIAGLDIPVFEGVKFKNTDYDLFETPLWADRATEKLRALVLLGKEIETMEEAIDKLRRELRITAQRVNLFEKIKIPEAREAIRLIKIYIGDQLANAVNRSKIAKRKIEAYVAEEEAA